MPRSTPNRRVQPRTWDPGPWTRDPGSGSRGPGPGTRSRNPGPGFREPGHGSRALGPGTRVSVSGTRDTRPGLRDPRQNMKSRRGCGRGLWGLPKLPGSLLKALLGLLGPSWGTPRGLPGAFWGPPVGLLSNKNPDGTPIKVNLRGVPASALAKQRNTCRIHMRTSRWPILGPSPRSACS